MIKVRVLIFAHLAEKVGTGEVEMEVNADFVKIEYLLQKLGLTAEQVQHCIFTINCEQISPLDGKWAVKDGDELAIIPPVSGG